MNENLRRQYMQRMGITLWEPRDVALQSVRADIESDPLAESFAETATQAGNSSNAVSPVADTGRNATPGVPGLDIQTLDWQGLQTVVSRCTACELHTTRTQTVFGSGNPDAALMIIGEAPGAEEDRQGLPFVGRAGQLLTEMLHAIGFAREQVFIANTLKCRPPNNRDPRTEEVASCEPFLVRQIQSVNPDVILAVGRIAAHNILKTQDSLAKLRKRVHQFPGMSIPVYVSYHPAYLLRSPSEKQKAWQDLKQVKAALSRASAEEAT